MLKPAIIVVLCCIVCSDFLAVAQTNFYNPSQSVKYGNSAVKEYITIYQKFLSGIRGGECPMYPSCSYYGMSAFQTQPFTKALMNTTDRLMRCGHDHARYDIAYINSDFKYVDLINDSLSSVKVLGRPRKISSAYRNADYSEDTKEFIVILINKGLYREALIEIYRQEFISKVFDVNLCVNKFICLNAIEEYEKVIFEYEVELKTNQKTIPEIVYEAAYAQYRLSNYAKSLEYIHNSALLPNESTEYLNNRIMLLKVLNLAQMKQYELCNTTLDTMKLNVLNSHQIVVNRKLINDLMNFKPKKPAVAGLLSIIPGMGYVYSSNWQSGVSAFLINGLLGYATYTNFKTKNYGMGALTGLFFISFYTGNISGSIKSTNKLNLSIRKDILLQLERNSKL